MWLAALPDLGFALAFLAAWLSAGMLSPTLVSGLVLTIELEALSIMLAFGVMVVLIVLITPSGVREKLYAAALGLGGIGWAVGEGMRHGSWWPAIILAGLLANRIGALVTGQLRDDDAMARLGMDAVWAFGIYAAVVAVSLGVDVPAVGQVAALPAEHARWCALPGELAADVFETKFTADWCAAPHRALAAGALYFMVAVWRDVRRTRAARRAR